MTEVFLTLLRFFCLMASNFGYYNLLRKKTNLDISFIPIITIGFQISVLMLAGMLNLLLPAAAAMLAAGLLLFAFDLVHGSVRDYKCFAAVPYVYMGICFLLVAFVLYKSFFYRFDDFSHWALAVQELLVSNRFPNFSSQMILFQTYPLGSTSYVYYCCLIAGTDEWVQMLIQAFMLICGLMPLFSCCQKRKLWLLFPLIVFTNFVLVYNVPLASLLVDTLLPLVGMSAALITWDIREHWQQRKNSQRDIWMIAPLLITTVMIKNSGIFFILPSIMILLAMWRKNPEFKLQCAGTILSPFAAVVIWRQHCKYVFPDAMDSKHTVSIQNYAAEFSQKSAEEIGDIAKGMLSFLLGHRAILYILAGLAAIVLMKLFIHKTKVKGAIQFSCLVIIGYLAYMAGLYGMFVFSMPTEEAIILNELSRYVATMDIAVFYLILAVILKEINVITLDKRFLMAVIATFTAIILAWGNLAHWQFVIGNGKAPVRVKLDTAIEQYNIPLGAACVVCNSDFYQEGYLHNMVKYTLWTSLVCSEDGFVENQMKNIESFDYLLMYDYNDETVAQWVQENRPEQYGNFLISLR